MKKWAQNFYRKMRKNLEVEIDFIASANQIDILWTVPDFLG